MVVIVIIGIMTTMMVPMFRGQNSQQKRMAQVAQLNKLMQGAWQNAITTDKLQKVEFDFTQQRIVLTQAKAAGLTTGEQQFESTGPGVLIDNIKWPDTYRMVNFYIEDKDEMSYGERDTAWFYIVPDGLAQQVIINFVDEKESEDRGFEVETSLVLNPFYAQFKEYNEFQRP